MPRQDATARCHSRKPKLEAIAGRHSRMPPEDIRTDGQTRRQPVTGSCHRKLSRQDSKAVHHGRMSRQDVKAGCPSRGCPSRGCHSRMQRQDAHSKLPQEEVKFALIFHNISIQNEEKPNYFSMFYFARFAFKNLQPRMTTLV